MTVFHLFSLCNGYSPYFFLVIIVYVSLIFLIHIITRFDIRYFNLLNVFYFESAFNSFD